MCYLQYFISTLRHKFWVCYYGFQLGIPFLSLIHDNSKFLPSEFIPHARFFYGDGLGKIAMDHAWFMHLTRNAHHPEYWVKKVGKTLIIADMPLRYRKEMLADWLARARHRDHVPLSEWYASQKFTFHDNTRKWVQQKLKEWK